MPNLNAAGIVDLSTLAPKQGTAPTAGPAGSYIVEVTNAGFDALVAKSMQFPIVLEFYSPRAKTEAASQMLQVLTQNARGRWLLGRINVDDERQLAAELQVQAVPLVAGVLAGQLVPLWQGTTDQAQAEAVLEQLMALAAQNGIVGKAEPVAGAEAPGGEAAEKPADPRFAAADAALEAGDFVKAREEFDKLYAQTPGDPEVIAGRAQAGLLARTKDANPDAVLAAATQTPDDVDAQLAAADLEVMAGQFEAGFGRLIAFIRDHRGDERDAARVRLLELFETVGNADPAVLKARRELTSALF